MPNKKRIDEIVARQDDLGFMFAGINAKIKEHNEPLITRLGEIKKEYDELEKEKQELLKKEEKESEEKA